MKGNVSEANLQNKDILAGYNQVLCWGKRDFGGSVGPGARKHNKTCGWWI